MGVLDDVYGPDPAPAGSALDAVYGPDESKRAPAAKPAKFLVAEPKPDAPSVVSVKERAQNREVTPLVQAAKGGLRQKAKLDAYSEAYLGENPGLLDQELSALDQYATAQTAKALNRAPPGGPMLATDKAKNGTEHPDFPSFLQTYGVAGLRPAGAATNAFADSLAKQLKAEHPEWSDEQLRAAMWQDSALQTAVKRPAVALDAAKAALATLKRGPGGVFDRSVPTFIEAPGQVIAKYGEEGKQQEHGGLAEGALNALRAALDLPASVLQLAMHNAQGTTALRNPQAPRPKPMTLREAVTTVGPETMEEKSGRTAPGIFGGRTTPGEANTLAAASTFALPVDALPLAVRGAGLARKGLGAIPVGPSIAKMADDMAFGAGQAAKRVRTIPAVDKAGSHLLGNSWDAKQAIIQAERMGKADPRKTAENAAALERVFNEVGPRQAQEVRRIADAAAAMKAPEREWEAISHEVENQPNRWMLRTLSPEARAAADTLKAEAAYQDARFRQPLGMRTREDYMAHTLTPEMQERMPPHLRSPAAEGAPEGVRFNLQRNLPEALQSEARAMGLPFDPRSAAAVNDYIRRNVQAIWTGAPASKIIAGYGPGAPFLKAADQPGLAYQLGLTGAEDVFNVNPKQVHVERFVPGALQGIRSEAYRNMAPMALPAGKFKTPGYVPTPEGSTLRAAAGEQIPEAAMRMVQRSETPPTKGALPINAWKTAVTVNAGPGYHLRNKLYSVQKRLGEFNPVELAAIERGFSQVDSGAQSTFAGLSLDQIRQAARDAGTWEGTGAGPIPEILRARREAGLLKDPIPTLRPLKELPAKVAQVTDEGERMRAILGHLARSEGQGTPADRLNAALDFANQFIVRTDNKSPALERASKLWPFIGWSVREAPNAAKAFAAGKMPLVPRLQTLAQANTEQKDQVQEKYIQRRAREGSAIPTGKQREAGFDTYMVVPGTPTQPISQMFDPLYRAAQGEPAKAVAKSAIQAAANQMLPPVGYALAEFSGERPLTRTPLEMPQRAAPWQRALVQQNPDLAPLLGLNLGQDGQWWTTGRAAMYAGGLPWSPAASALSAQTPQQLEGAALRFLGFTPIDVDPSVQDMLDRIERQSETELLQKRLTTEGALPPRIVYRKK